MPVILIIHMKSIKENKTDPGMADGMDDAWIKLVAVYLYLTNCDFTLVNLERDRIPQRSAFNLSS